MKTVMEGGDYLECFRSKVKHMSDALFLDEDSTPHSRC